MAKRIIIPLVLAVAIVGLLVVVSRQPDLRTVPVPTPAPLDVPRELPSPRVDVTPEQPTPRAQEIKEKPAGIPVERVFPEDVTFYVNNVFIPPSTSYEGGSFIRIQRDDVKTFAGSFGPYEEDPTPYLKVVLCAEFTDFEGAGACEQVQLLFRNQYVSFAKGYEFDEYIGQLAAKDYEAFFIVNVGDTKVAESNHARIRTV
ncbi:hypothetical protein HY489_00810 [Candidatus Woesearchaeota archaeon]|nr:hypothetical protein [Candidatus Woesearchaeota archaeon]